MLNSAMEDGEPDGDIRRADDERRFRAIYEAHYAAVLAYTRRRTRDPDDVQDAVAETFTVAWRRSGELLDPDTALPWLYGVARRVLANQRRANRRRLDLTGRLRGQATGVVDTETQVLTGEERRTVLAALARLRESDQEILRLAVWEELSHRDIAAIVDCAESAVAVRLHRARNRLAREIEKETRRGGQLENDGTSR